MTKRLTKEAYVRKAKLSHKNCDYTDSVYTTLKSNITVFCKNCEEYFTVNASNHLYRNSGCKNCKPKKKVHHLYQLSVKKEKERQTFQEIIGSSDQK